MEKNTTAYTEEFGKRLRILRNELQGADGKVMTQAEIAELTGLNQNVVYRLESGLGTALDKMLAYLNFFDSKGFNINWIVLFENHNIDKYKEDASQSFLSSFLDKESFMNQHKEKLHKVNANMKDAKSNLQHLLNLVGDTSTQIDKVIKNK